MIANFIFNYCYNSYNIKHKSSFVCIFHLLLICNRFKNVTFIMEDRESGFRGFAARWNTAGGSVF